MVHCCKVRLWPLCIYLFEPSAVPCGLAKTPTVAFFQHA